MPTPQLGECHQFFTTTGSSATVFREIPTRAPNDFDGWSYHIRVVLSSAEASVEPREHQSITHALAKRIGSTVTIVATEIEIRSNDFIAVEFSVSGTSIRIAVNPIDSSSWGHWIKTGHTPMPIRRYF